eukprot:gene7967-12433_t
MGNGLTTDHPKIDSVHLKPTGKLYQDYEWDLEIVKHSILQRKLAPFFEGNEEELENTDECPICMMYYKGGLNISNCCGQRICTDCFLQIKKPKTQPRPHCPFCNHKDYNIMYKGEKSKEERKKELIEEQKVIEAQIRAQEEERKLQFEREKKIKEERMSSPESLIEVEIKQQKIEKTSSSLPRTESLYDELLRQRNERNERLKEDNSIQTQTEQEMDDRFQAEEIRRRREREQQREQQDINLQNQMSRLKDYVPENIFNELSTTESDEIDYDTMMLNEAIRLSELAEKNRNEYSNVFIDGLQIDLSGVESNNGLNNESTNNNMTSIFQENPFVNQQQQQTNSSINEDVKIEDLTEEEQIEFAISLSLRE